MSESSEVVERLRYAVARVNQEIALDVGIRLVLGVIFSILTFGFLFWFGWVGGFVLGPQIGLSPFQLGAFGSSFFFLVALASAWFQVEPLAGLRRLTDRELMLTLASQAAGDVLYFSPRHASAGFAMVLIGGPANILEGVGLWATRIKTSPELLENAADLLASCEDKLPLRKLRRPQAAALLRRLQLIKMIPLETEQALTLTERGGKLLGGRRKGKRVS